MWGISYGPGGAASEDWSPTELAQIMYPALVRGGPHAWGWMALLDDGVYYDKRPGRCDTPQAMEHMHMPDNPKWLVGHTRWATHGSPEDNRNNHPLQHGNIIGVHNGKLTNHHEVLSVTGREDPKTEVDSEAIFAAVNKWGHRPGLRRINGEMVAIYCNLEKPETLHIARTYGKYLSIARTVNGSIIWASEQQAIFETGIDLEFIQKMKRNHLVRVREGKIRFNGAYKEELRPARSLNMDTMRAIQDAHDFIDRERATMANRKQKAKKLTPTPRFGEKQQGMYWAGPHNGWVSQREFIALVMDEQGWD